MEPAAFLSPWRIVLGLLPLPYGAVLLLDVAGSFFWLVVISVVVLGLLVLAYSLGYPLVACWQAFSALFVVLTCVVMLVQGVPVDSALPLTGSPIELWCISLLALVLVIWSGNTARQLLMER
jgi:hypothetical protein